MNKEDRKIRRLLKKEKISIPPQTSSRFDATVSWIQNSIKRRPHFFTIGLRLTAVLLILAFCILPNINQDIAYAMQDIPVIEKIVRVITVYKYEKQDENHAENIQIPQIEADGDYQDSVDALNADIKKLTDMAIEEFRQNAQDLPDSHFDLYIDYDIITNTSEWFTLKITIAESAGTGGNAYRYYHIDKKRGEIVSLSDLFVPGFDYVTVFSENIKKQMAEQMEKNENIIYWMYSDDKTFWGFYEIAPDQNFYFNENNDLVIVFNKYEVAPGSMGYPEFIIPLELYEGNR